MADSPIESLAGIPLLQTKLYVPGLRPGLIARPRLIDRMHAGMESKLTLIAAPAGFGKTTLLAEWLAATPEGGRTAGWVSLDQSDNDPAIFWAYIITALQKAQPGVGDRALSLLHSPQPPAMESVLTILINEIHALEDDVALILDDYHVIEADSIHKAVAFLLDHLPQTIHVVIAGRTDPDLPLARLRARGELTELRAADLRFTTDEASAFLHDVMGLDLSSADVAALEARTEGWIAGLQLAALSVQGRGDVHGFIEAFSGDNTYIADYLVEEVLQRQPERARRFLLQTSILGRLCGPLCDAVTEEDDGQFQLEAMERGNLFVVALDDRRHWYRYHHLFADVLQSRLKLEHSDQIGTLHRRASVWYEQNGSPADAVRHALASDDMRRAAGLIETAWPVMDRNHQSATWLGWAKALPDELVRAMPVLSMGYAWALLDAGKMETAEIRLRDVERWLPHIKGRNDRTEDPSVEMIVVDEAQFQSLPQSMATARAYLAQALGDFPGSVKHARQALDLIPAGDHFARAPAAALLGLAYWASGEMDEAHRTFGAGMASLRAAGAILSALGGSFVLADIEVAQGRLQEAAGTCKQALLLASEQIQTVFPGMGELNLVLSEIHREWGDLDAAAQYVLAATGTDEEAESTGKTSRWYTAMARIEEARGDLGRAYDLLDEAERVHVRTPIPDVRPVAARKARIRLAQGRMASVMDWVKEQGLSAADDLSYMREFEHITLAKALIARYRADRIERSILDAMQLLSRLRQAAEEGKRTGSVIEILVLQALAHDVLGDISQALDPLERALTLAEPGKYFRIFVDEGEPMRRLLRHAAAAGIGGSYTRRLLSAFDEPAPPDRTATGTSSSGLVQPLTLREVEILRLIAAGMRNQEIADQLFISPSTVKRHIANAYGKLDVGHRMEAIARANELNLL